MKTIEFTSSEIDELIKALEYSEQNVNNEASRILLVRATSVATKNGAWDSSQLTDEKGKEVTEEIMRFVRDRKSSLTLLKAKLIQYRTRLSEHRVPGAGE